MNDDDLGYDRPDQGQDHSKCITCKKWFPARQLHHGLDCDGCYRNALAESAHADQEAERMADSPPTGFTDEF